MMNSVLSEVFQTVLNLSLVGSYVILFVLAARLALKNAPRWCSYLLWGIVFLRLICPVFPETRFSLIPSGLEQEAVNEVFAERQEIQEASPQVNFVNNMEPSGTAKAPGIEETFATKETLETKETSGIAAMQTQEQELPNVELQGQTLQGQTLQEQPLQQNKNTQPYGLAILWLVGALLLAAYHTYSYWHLKMKVKSAVAVEPDVREVQGEHLSFVMGIFHPTIYLSEGLDEESRKVVLCHERVHLQRRDYLTKPAALAICCVHWFNPLVWLAFVLMNKDCEMSCDEKVVSLLGEESKKIYSYALLDEATRGERRFYKKKTVCALLSFGEDNVKSRISHVLHYKKASLWMIVCAVIALVVLVIGLCSNPGSNSDDGSMIVERAYEIVMEEGGYPENADTQGFLADYDGDDKQEFFLEIGEKEAGTEHIKGELWFVSKDGEAELLLEDKLFYKAEDFITEDKLFKLISYQGEDCLHTKIYGVRNDNAEALNGDFGDYEKYVDGENIVCLYTDSELEYDIRELTFSGYDQKKYVCYYNGQYFEFYNGHDLTREEVAAYDNGEEILKNLEESYPEATFEYLARENQWLHINYAYREQDIVKFRHATYEGKDGKLILLEEGPGCYKAGIDLIGGTPFTKQIAKEYGWQDDNSLAPSQLTPESALDRFAWAFSDRDADTLYQISSDKENFLNWDMVFPRALGGYGFGDSSPWPAPGAYTLEYTEGSDEATIRFFVSNSAPEIYIAEEKVKLVKKGLLYFVDHVTYKMYDNIETRQELAEIYDLDGENPFASINTGYDSSFPRIILQHILNQTNPEYYVVYTNPITSAKKLLHLGDGSGEITETLHAVKLQNPLSSSWGEGSVVNVRYTFAKDGSTVDIPMVLAEESENIWVLSTGDLSEAASQGESPLSGECVREVYKEFTKSGERIINDQDAFPSYQFTSFGVYRLDDQGLTCVYPSYIPWDIPVDFYEGQLYFPTDSHYSEGALDWMYDCIRGVNPETGYISTIYLSEE